MKINSIKTDPVKAKEGIWVGDIPDFPGVRLKVRPAGNGEYRVLYQQLVATIPRFHRRAGVVTDVVAKAGLDGRCLADTVLLDWEGFEDNNDKPLAYTPELAKSLLIDPEMGDLRDAVNFAASVAAEEARISLDDDAGNSKPRSVGGSTGVTS